jgi:hypothetical protein
MRPSTIICFMMLASAMLTLASGCAATVAAPADDTARRYHDGERSVEVVVALDRLHLERVAADGARATEVYLLRQPVASVAALEDVARQVAAAQPDVRSISAYVRAAGEPRAVQPVRVTRQFAVRGSAGQDLEALAARHGARVLERVDYSPDTAICEATGPGLLAAIDAANALRQEPGVVFAMPLIERAHAARTR